MSRDSLKTLYHPFATETLPLPGKDERYLFLGAEAGVPVPEGFEASVVAVQGMRPEFLRLTTARQEPLPAVDGEDYDGALILVGKHRGENENRVAEALKRVKTGGYVVAAGGKEDGIGALRKRLAGLGLSVEHMPKYHGVAVWFQVPEERTSFIEALEAREALIEGQFHTMPGLFSHDHVDPGSELLASRLPTDFDGNAADFGAGWGYLSAMLAERAPKTARIDLFEADHQSLEFAKRNLAALHPDLTARFFWQDLVSEPPKEKYDLVIMNPPFHQGHATEPSLGVAFIKTASGALRHGGTLLLVANRGLPYEQQLATEFRESGEVCRNSKFKVLWARK